MIKTETLSADAAGVACTAETPRPDELMANNTDKCGEPAYRQGLYQRRYPSSIFQTRSPRQPRGPGTADLSVQRHFASIDFEDWYADIEKVPGAFNGAFLRQYSSIVECLQQTATRCTFFVLGRTAERYPQLVADLHTMGHEIASHGYAHERVDRQTPAQFAQDLDRSVAAIRDITGTPPLGYRAPYFSVTRRQFWIYEILAERGFMYSSSIFPFAGKRYGVGDFGLGPQTITTASGRIIIEYPLAVVDFLGRRIPVAGGGFWRLLPKALTRRSVRAVAMNARGFVSYFHPHEFDPDPIRSHKGVLRNLYLNVGRRSVRAKFIDALRSFDFHPFAEDGWRQ